MTNYKLERRIEEILFQNTRVNPSEDRIVTDVWQLRDKFYELINYLLNEQRKLHEDVELQTGDTYMEDFLNETVK